MRDPRSPSPTSGSLPRVAVERRGHAGAAVARALAGLADDVAQQVDVADPHRDHQVAGTGELGDPVGHRVVVRLVDHPLGRQRDQIGDRRAGDTGDRFLARREDVHHDRDVGQRHRVGELAREGLGAAVGAGLEHRDQPAAAGRPLGRLERGRDLGRMVGVVVEHAHSPADAVRLEPAVHAAGRNPTTPARCRGRDRVRPPSRARRSRSAPCVCRSARRPARAGVGRRCRRRRTRRRPRRAGLRSRRCPRRRACRRCAPAGRSRARSGRRAAAPSSSAQHSSSPLWSMRSTNSSKARKIPSRSPWFSRWSASTLVTMAAAGRASRKDPSLSSASTMASSPVPRWAFLPVS